MKKVKVKAKGKYKLIILKECLMQKYIIYGYNTIDNQQEEKLHTIPATEPLSRARGRCLISWLENAYISFVENNINET